MIELIKRAAMLGLGVASITKDKVESLAEELIAKGKMSEQEGERFVADVMKRSEESYQSLNKQIEKMIEGAVDKMKLVKTSDLEALKLEVADLRKEIEALKNK
jgi:polyhydroxyalkanoate synthesis regulator phasin